MNLVIVNFGYKIYILEDNIYKIINYKGIIRFRVQQIICVLWAFLFFLNDKYVEKFNIIVLLKGNFLFKIVSVKDLFIIKTLFLKGKILNITFLDGKYKYPKSKKKKSLIDKEKSKFQLGSRCVTPVM